MPYPIRSKPVRQACVGAAFGTVVVCTPEPVEVTTFRRDADYLDKRRPSGVFFSSSVHEDLARRDFTMNAIAWDFVSERLIDPYDGLSDLRKGIIRTVGDPRARFNEDALRLLRAVRFACELDFDLANETWEAAESAAHLVEYLSNERIRDGHMFLTARSRKSLGCCTSWVSHASDSRIARQ